MAIRIPACQVARIVYLLSFLTLVRLLSAPEVEAQTSLRVDTTLRTSSGFVTLKPKVDDPPKFYELATLSDGTILVSYFDKNIYKGKPIGAIAAINSNGKLSKKFKVKISSPSRFQPLVYTIFPHTIDGEEKILIEGYFNKVNGVKRNGIARLNADGSLDTSFDPGIGVRQKGRNPINGKIYLKDDKYILIGGIANYQGVALQGLLVIDKAGDLVPNIPAFPDNYEVVIQALKVEDDGIRGYGFVNDTTDSYTVRHGSQFHFNNDLQLDSAVFADDPYKYTCNGGEGYEVLESGVFYKYCTLLRSKDGLRLPGIIKFNADGSEDLTFAYSGPADRAVYFVAALNPSDPESDLLVIGRGNGAKRYSYLLVKADGGISSESAPFSSSPAVTLGGPGSGGENIGSIEEVHRDMDNNLFLLGGVNFKFGKFSNGSIIKLIPE